MPFLPRQERFCRAFVHYGTASTAAQSAGYAPQSANRQGWRLLRAPRIQARIRELQAELAAHQDRADDAIFGKLEVVYRRALQNHQFYAAARSAQLQAQLIRRQGGDAEAVAPTTARPAPEMDRFGVQMCTSTQKPSQKYTGAEVSADAATRPGGSHE